MNCYKDASEIECKENCESVLKCGHVCKNKCYECFDGTIHNECKEECKRILICGHLCKSTCGESCQTCECECIYKCAHGKCKLKCGDFCNNCEEKCNYKCQHSECFKKCIEICDRKICNEKCKKKQICGHNCIGICGEKCPDICRICNENNKIFQFCTLSQTKPKDNSLYYQLDCGDIFEINSLNNYMM